MSRTKKTDADALREQLRQVQARLWAHEQKERDRQLKASIGHFYKYKNCYSCPQTESDRWWLYSAVVNRNGIPTRAEFQTDKDGKTEFRYDRMFLSDGWIEITREEFKRELDKAQSRFREFSGII